MEGSISGKGVPQSSSRYPSAIPKPSLSGAGETNENVMNPDRMMNSKLHNHKKPLNKHFMSPTISQASKTAIREKNILGERNEADSSCGPIQNSPSHVAKTNTSKSGSRRSSFSSQSCVSGSNDGEQKSGFVADSSSNQYDPLTNYLSPRPKYLRYKPNRRREIFLHLENMGGEGNDGLGVETKAFVGDEGSMGHAQESSPLPPPQEINVQPENGEIIKKEDDGDDDSNAQPENEKIPENENEDADDDKNEVVGSEDDEDVEEDEEEGYFEENGWSLNWLLKLLLIVAIVLLSPLFVSLMNNPPSSPTEPVMMNGFDDISPVLGVVPFEVNGSISDYQNKIEVSTIRFLELDQGEVGNEPDKVELAEDEEEEIFSEISIELDEMAGPTDGLGEDSDQELEKETTETDMADDNAEEAFDYQLPILEPTENKVDAVSEMENEGFGIPNASDNENFATDSGEDHEKTEISESLDIPNASENENFASVVQEFDQMDDEYEPSSKESHGETFLETQMERYEDTNEDMDNKISVDYSEESDTSNSDGSDLSIYSKLQQIGLTPAAALAIVSILSLILTYAISIYYSARKARASHKHSNPAVEPPQQESTRADEILTAVIPNVEKEQQDDERVDGKKESIEETSKDDHQRYTSSNLFPQLENSYRVVEMAIQDDAKQLFHSVYSAEASSLLRSVKDSSMELSHTKTLGVELLGELVIGEVSSSLRTPARKTRLPETEESSSYSFSQVNGSRLLNSQTSESSYGRFTTEKKLIKKEGGGKNGEAKKEITTPVRRSSRIRNRAVMSPSNQS